MKRIVVMGTSGSGKTFLARELSKRLGAPHVEFDAYRHGPNWAETPDDLFRQRLAEALEGDRWVADGNYSVARDVVWPRATTLVWLDYSMSVVLWRLARRTFRRGLMREELWNGNRENLLSHLFTRESLFLWVMKTHWKRRKTLPVAFQQPQYANVEKVRLRSPRSARQWLRRVGP
jgi:adenylate kinase family enzyme